MNPDWLTAGATVLAAIGTVGALVFAARAASAASRSAETANNALAAEARPLLLDVPYEYYTDHEHEYPWPGESMRKTPVRGQIIFDPQSARFVFPVRNVGRGVARIKSFSICLSEADADYAEQSTSAIPVGEDVWLAGEGHNSRAFWDALNQTPTPVHGPMPFIFTVNYTDIAGQQPQRLELGVGAVGQDRILRVLTIEHVSLDGETAP